MKSFGSSSRARTSGHRRSTPCSIATPGAPSAPTAGRAAGTELSRPTQPNALWCADYKGEFLLGNRRYCYPLTITDFASRYLLTCEALLTTQEKFAFTVFERTFKEFGLPQGIRTDNGVPFASAHALYGLSKLAVWWLRLGIHIERIKPGHPQQNGRHERMHLTLKRTRRSRPPRTCSSSRPGSTTHHALQHGPAAPGARVKVPADLYGAHRACIGASRNSPIPSRSDHHGTGCGRMPAAVR